MYILKSNNLGNFQATALIYGEKTVTWNALSGQLCKNLAIAPALIASGGRRETVGAGR